MPSYVVNADGIRVRKSNRKREIEAENGDWYVLCCVKCYAMFDAPVSKRSLPGMCPECRKASAVAHNRRYRARVTA